MIPYTAVNVRNWNKDFLTISYTRFLRLLLQGYTQKYVEIRNLQAMVNEKVGNTEVDASKEHRKISNVNKIIWLYQTEYFDRVF